MLPFIKEVDEEYTPLSSEILVDLKLSSREATISDLRKRQEGLRGRLSVQTVQGDVIKLPIHSNTDQRELRVHIGSLQRLLDKPIAPRDPVLSNRRKLPYIGYKG
jgi:hypothetical protein